ncbi:MAG: hypothetical protein ACEPO2_16530 [Pelagibaca sp.]
MQTPIKLSFKHFEPSEEITELMCDSIVDEDFAALQQRNTAVLVAQTGESPTGPRASTARPIGSMDFDPATKPSRR